MSSESWKSAWSTFFEDIADKMNESSFICWLPDLKWIVQDSKREIQIILIRGKFAAFICHLHDWSWFNFEKKETITVFNWNSVFFIRKAAACYTLKNNPFTWLTENRSVRLCLIKVDQPWSKVDLSWSNTWSVLIHSTDQLWHGQKVTNHDQSWCTMINHDQSRSQRCVFSAVHS